MAIRWLIIDLFSDDFDDALDGIGFSILAERDAIYFTCIPALRKLSDSIWMGWRIRTREIVEGFGVRVSLLVTTFMVLSEDRMVVFTLVLETEGP